MNTYSSRVIPHVECHTNTNMGALKSNTSIKMVAQVMYVSQRRRTDGFCPLIKMCHKCCYSGSRAFK